ncbi:fumarylacetoacetate hydrolase family protein [Acuticoccus sp. MNP-M23]|uniref:fumarylacetoacetate hydrolase family protein n=1 Tax=Acuticoccus sp. MNP-M23 TaxID=3072793 RepID=UPI002814F8ED|nr:fumarylacetoacetate hydrolase family protein [Acuticoccus sp. MNP-M23]WMS41520.1 fumarylacetoacetate hydrolase family protein [Acuticoccus sp. MNP-M23]
MDMTQALPQTEGALVGRVWRPGIGPSVVAVRGGDVVDITSREFATMRDVTEATAPADIAASAPGESFTSTDALFDNADETTRDTDKPHPLAPIDLQAIKASGVTFVTSLLERVIEEQARGDMSRAAALRTEIVDVIGADLSQLTPGSDEAMALKAVLQEKGVWSQYLEVGIGPDAEIFTKSQPMSAVGHGANVGIHPVSTWNNPEPEIVLVVRSDGTTVGATLGNDVNLRDVEGRSALLLGKAKDNNASASLGPFIRLYDGAFVPEDVATADLAMVVEGLDGFRLEGRSSMAEISRSPDKLVAATIGSHHQYPDGLVLYCGTMFAPTKDRDGEGKGFTHHEGDLVKIKTPALGALINRVTLSTKAAPWTFGTRALMQNLAGRNLL